MLKVASIFNSLGQRSHVCVEATRRHTREAPSEGKLTREMVN